MYISHQIHNGPYSVVVRVNNAKTKYTVFVYLTRPRKKQKTIQRHAFDNADDAKKMFDVMVAVYLYRTRGNYALN
jgi:hypothetical protein